MNYAEQVLGVHSVYDEAKAATADLKEAHKAVVEWAGQKRDLVESINDRTAVLTGELRATYNDMSATAFKPVLDNALQLDDDLKRLRRELASAQREHDRAEAAVREIEQVIRVLSTRMDELGGLLHFYAAVKTIRQQVNATS